jgi:hypothetical protein
MKLIVPTHHSRAIQRISDALAADASLLGHEVARPETIRKDVHRSRPIEGEADGDVLVMLVNGLHDHFYYQADRCRKRGQKFAVVQIALRTTRQPSTNQWRELWRDATVVWSYYPIADWIAADGGDPVDFNFYHAPLGVDASVFTPEPAVARDVLVCTSGFRRSQEGVGECDDAAAALKAKVFQLGPQYSMKSETIFKTGISDEELAAMYRRCRFVSGLRRHEGFELPAAEGLLCGARPVMYDQPHYRQWFGDWAEYVAERDPKSVTLDLVALFQTGGRYVTEAERKAAAARFNWSRISRDFWATGGVE